MFATAYNRRIFSSLGGQKKKKSEGLANRPGLSLRLIISRRLSFPA